MINNYKMNKIVEYIKLSGFEYEIAELEEDLKNILAFYGILDLSEEEYQFLKSELLPLAEDYELSEVAYLASYDDSLFSSSFTDEHFADDSSFA